MAHVNKRAYRVPTSQRVAQKRANDNSWKSDGGEKQLPLCNFLDVAIVRDARNDSPREYYIRESHEIVYKPGQIKKGGHYARQLTIPCPRRANEWPPVTLENQVIWYLF